MKFIPVEIKRSKLIRIDVEFGSLGEKVVCFPQLSQDSLLGPQ